MSLLVALRASRPVAQQLLIRAVKFYRLMLSPWLGSCCRFEPTCSAYALNALESHGATAGAYLSARRLLRCHPWCSGGCDPVPAPRHLSLTTAAAAPPLATDHFEKNLS
jgi:putative membrane protein insertion efficiency factor